MQYYERSLFTLSSGAESDDLAICVGNIVRVVQHRFDAIAVYERVLTLMKRLQHRQYQRWPSFVQLCCVSLRGATFQRGARETQPFDRDLQSGDRWPAPDVCEL